MNNCSANQLAYLRKCKHHRIFICICRFLLLIGFLFFWEYSANAGIVDSFIFSSPSRIVRCFWQMVLDRSIFVHVGVTLYETLVSFIFVIFFSIFVAVLLWMCNSLSEILEPYLVVLNSLPKSALAPLLIVWFGATKTTIIIAGMSVAIFGSILTLYTCFKNVDEEKFTLIYTLQGTKFHVLTKVILPGNIPAIISTMKVNIGLCLVGVVIGEFIGGREGLGYLIIYGSQVFKLDWLLMSICILCIIAMGLYGMIGAIETHYLKRK
mgnify:CR=1 FL=1